MPPRNRRERALEDNWFIAPPVGFWGPPITTSGGPVMSQENLERGTIQPGRVMGMDVWDEVDELERALDSIEPQDAVDTRTIMEMERMFMEQSLRRNSMRARGEDPAPQVNIKRHLSKSERDSRHKPAKDVKKIVAISLDDLVSI